MNKSELVKAVAADAGLSSADARKAVDALIDTVEASFRKGDAIPPRTFGKFVVVEKNTPKASSHKGSGRRRTAAGVGRGRSAFTDELRRIHRDAGLSDRTIAEAVGVAPSTVRDWLAQRTSPTGVRAERVAALVEIVDRLMRVMSDDYIPLWLNRPIQALDDRRPLELLASGRLRPLAQLISSLEYPVAA
jgi:putative toxin-antitoxin system antitoxin component (TIGR02293 family)